MHLLVFTYVLTEFTVQEAITREYVAGSRNDLK
jgi:hypothetical protein